MCVVAAVIAVDTGVALAVDTCVVVTTSATATVVDSCGDDVVVVTAGNGADVAPVEVTGGGMLTVFRTAEEGVVEVCSLEGAAAAVVVTRTGGDVVTETVSALVVGVKLVDVAVEEGVQAVTGAAGGFAEEVAPTEAVVACAAT